MIECTISGPMEVLSSPIGRLHQQVAFDFPSGPTDALVTVSGGVGELVYANLAGKALPSRTVFGDLGIDLARGLLKSDVLAPSLKAIMPPCAGRATLYGLLRHTTQIGGSTLFLSDPALLPLRDLPILGRLTKLSTDEQIRDILDLAIRSPTGAAVCVELEAIRASELATFGTRLARALIAVGFPASLPLVLLVRENVGKALGHYVRQWGTNPFQILVIDEIDLRDARIVRLGAMYNQVVPVSLYGLN